MQNFNKLDNVFIKVFVCFLFDLFTEKTNQSIFYQILPHPGNKLRYSWDFGDGNVTNTTDNTIDHTFIHSGVYTVTLYSWNEVSDDYFSVSMFDCMFYFIMLSVRSFRVDIL